MKSGVIFPILTFVWGFVGVLLSESVNASITVKPEPSGPENSIPNVNLIDKPILIDDGGLDPKSARIDPDSEVLPEELAKSLHNILLPGPRILAANETENVQSEGGKEGTDDDSDDGYVSLQETGQGMLTGNEAWFHGEDNTETKSQDAETTSVIPSTSTEYSTTGTTDDYLYQGFDDDDDDEYDDYDYDEDWWKSDDSTVIPGMDGEYSTTTDWTYDYQYDNDDEENPIDWDSIGSTVYTDSTTDSNIEAGKVLMESAHHFDNNIGVYGGAKVSSEDKLSSGERTVYSWTIFLTVTLLVFLFFMFWYRERVQGYIVSFRKPSSKDFSGGEDCKNLLHHEYA